MMYALAVTGPTASGKTALSIELARRLCGEIISCDSMQIYKDMNIGTAKPTDSERTSVPHHLIDFVSPDSVYSADNYREDALRVAREIISRGNLPIFVGGTGLYLDTVLRASAKEVPPSDPSYRNKILSGIKSEADVDMLFARLVEVDPETAGKTHKNNIKRVVRALEIYDSTGKPKSYFDELTRNTAPPIKIDAFTLDFHNRDTLYARIDRRVDAMISEGLIEEAEALYRRGLLTPDTTAGQAIGYKELFEYFEGRATATQASERIKLASRRYAKRQLTWFRHTKAERIYLDDEDGNMKDGEEVAHEILGIIKKQKIECEKK